MASILVAGAGIAGLSCAYRLQLAGHEVEVLEREATPGGRLQSEQHGEFIIERGADCISADDRNLQGLLAGLQLGASLRSIAQRDDAVLQAGRLQRAHWGSPLDWMQSSVLSPLSRVRLARIALDWARYRHQLDPLHPERAGALDREDAASYLTRTVGREACDSLVAPLLSAQLYCDVHELSQAAALSALRQQASASSLQTMDGGLGGIATALAARVPVRTGCEVIGVHTESEGVRLALRSGGRDRLVVADALVMAVPGPLIPALCPKLTPMERGYFESLRFSRGLVANLMTAEEPRGMTHRRIGFARPDGFDLYGVTAVHRNPRFAPPGAGLLRAAFTADAASRVWDLPDEEIVELACENLARTPIGVIRPIAAVLHRHALLMPLFSSGSGRRLAAFLSRGDRSPRLAFAGDYLVGPSVEAAVTSGMRAATEIAHSLHSR